MERRGCYIDCPYVIWEELLTPEMLDDLIDYCDNLKLEQAGMFNKAQVKIYYLLEIQK